MKLKREFIMQDKVIVLKGAFKEVKHFMNEIKKRLL